MTQWTEERRRQQAETIRKNKPWEKSTGPRTRKGKKSSRLNALKHGGRSKACQNVRKMLVHQEQFVKFYKLYFGADALEMPVTNELIRKVREIKEITKKNGR